MKCVCPVWVRPCARRLARRASGWTSGGREAGQALTRHVHIVVGDFPHPVNIFWISDFLFVYTNYKLEVRSYVARMRFAWYLCREGERTEASRDPFLDRQDRSAFIP